MLKSYLLFNAALYILFALWCTIAPEKTAGVLGLAFRSGSGKCEYITVYGGLEFGLGLFFLLAGLRPELREAGLILAICFYGGLVLWRLPTLALVPGIHRVTFGFAAAEFVLCAMAAALWFTNHRS
jgi:hypothetical protein